MDNYEDGVVLNGTDGEDEIYNNADNVTINAEAGWDNIQSYGNNNVINGGADNDWIMTNGENNTVSGGEGKDDFIFLGGSMIITEYEEDEWIELECGFTKITSEMDSDGGVTFTFDDYHKIYIANGVEFMGDEYWNIAFFKDGEFIQVPVDGTWTENPFTDGDDYYEIQGTSNVTLDALGGNDTVVNYASDNIYINGNSGNDVIRIEAGINNTVAGGEGNDRAEFVDAQNSTYVYTGGNDTVTGFNFYNYLVIDGDYEVTSYDSNTKTAIITTSNGTITLQLGDELEYYNSDPIIMINEEPVQLHFTFTDGDDYYENNESFVEIDALGGNDTVVSSYAATVFINGNSGNDVIRINGGSDNVVSGGEGDDLTEFNDAQHSSYFYAGGDDTVTGFKSSDNLFIDYDYEITSYDAEENIAIIQTEEGTITIQFGEVNSDNSVILINEEEVSLPVETSPFTNGDDYYENYDTSNVTLDALGGNDTIVGENFNSVYINGNTGNDVIQINYGFNNTVTGGTGDDRAEFKYAEDSTYVYTGGNDAITGFQSNDNLVIDGDYEVTKFDVTTKTAIITTSSGTITLQLGDELEYYDNGVIIMINEEPVQLPFTFTDGDDYYENHEYNLNFDMLGGNDTVVNNNAAYVFIEGNTGNDVIQINGGYDNTVSGGAGNDRAELSDAQNSTYVYTGGNDTVTGFQSNDNLVIDGDYEVSSYDAEENIAIIQTEGGTITIKLSEVDPDNPVIRINDEEVALSVETSPFTDGDDYYEIQGTSNVTLDALGGNDTVISYGSDNIYINGNSGNDVIRIEAGINNTVAGGEGNDRAEFVDAQNSTYVYTGGNDTITGFQSNDNLVIDGDYKISSYDAEENTVVIQTSDGSIVLFLSEIDSANPFIIINGEEIQLSPFTEENDYYLNTEDNVELNALGGDDYIVNSGSNVTINGGAGDDIIINDGGSQVVYQYANGDGNDIIYGFNENDTLEITSGSYTASVSGEDWIISVGSGKITLQGAAENDYVLLKDASGSLSSLTPEVPPPTGWRYNTDRTALTATVSTADNIDLNEDYGEGVTTVDGARISSGVEIIAHDEGVSIKTGRGDDTVYSGAGADTVSLGAGADIFIYQGGDDIVQDYGTGADVIQINTANFEFVENEAATVGSDVVYMLKDSDGNEGTLTLLDAANKTITFIDENGETIDPYPLYVIGTEGRDDISQSRDNATIAALGENDTITSSGNEVSINAGEGADRIYLTGGENVSVYGGAGGDTIYNESTGGIVYMYNLDGVADSKDIIVGYNENDTIYIEEGVYSYDGSDNDFKITIGSNAANVVTLKDAAEKIVTVVDGAGNVDTIELGPPLPTGWGYGNNAKTHIKATIDSAENIDLNEDYGVNILTVDGSKITGGVEITGNDLGNSIKASNDDDYVVGGTGDDTVSLGGGADVYIYQGGDDTIRDFATVDAIQFAAGVDFESSETVDDDYILTTSEGTLTILKGSAKASLIVVYDADGERVAHNGPLPPDGWQIIDGVAKATDDSAESAVNFNDDFGTGVTKIDASKITSGVEITGNDLSDSIKGSKGDDLITGGTGDDTVSLGGGDDVYIYTGGDDIIQDFATVDVIQFAAGVGFESAATVDNDYVLTTSEGTLTILKGRSKASAIVVYDADGEWVPHYGPLPPEGWQVKEDLAKATIDSAESEINLNDDFGTNVTRIDASKITSGVEITGSDLGNSIKASRGDDLITGGTGDDTVSLGGGADVYVYTGGDDTIQDFATVDAIQFASGVTFRSSETVDDDYFITTSEGTLTFLKGKAKASLIVVYDADGERVAHNGPLPPEGWQITDGVAKAINASAESAVDFNEDFGTGVTKIDASKITSGVEIIGNDLGDSIKASKGADEITGGTGDDTISLGGGADVYVYTGGDDIIQDFATVDAIHFAADVTFESAATVDNDYVLTTSEGTLTFLKGKSKASAIVVYDADGEWVPHNGPRPPEGWQVKNELAKATIASAENEINLSEDFSTNVTKIDASKITDGVTITGNDFGNSIKGSKGDDYILGGTGDDTISLGGGDDVYVYTGGEDFIQDYKAVDTLVLGSSEYSLTSVDTVSSNVVYTFNNGEGAVTVKGGKGKTISFVDMDGDAISAGVSGRSAMAVNDLFADDNFISNDAQIADVSEITETNYSVGKVETGTVELAQDTLSAALAYSQEK